MEQINDSNIITELRRTNVLDVNYGIGLIGGSKNLYEKTVRQVIRILPDNFKQMDEYLESSFDLPGFAVYIHGVKGSLKQIGCHKLADLAEQLEAAAKDGDINYCKTNYLLFKERLGNIYEVILAVLSRDKIDKEACAKEKYNGSIADFLEVLLYAKDACENFDSISAVNCLAPLKNLSFNDEFDGLILKALEAFEAFKPRLALNYLEALLRECKTVALRTETEVLP